MDNLTTTMYQPSVDTLAQTSDEQIYTSIESLAILNADFEDLILAQDLPASLINSFEDLATRIDNAIYSLFNETDDLKFISDLIDQCTMQTLIDPRLSNLQSKLDELRNAFDIIFNEEVWL